MYPSFLPRPARTRLDLFRSGSNFITLLRCLPCGTSQGLPSRNWEDKIRARILGDHLRTGTRFLTWANGIQSLNCVIRGTPSHLDDHRLHDQIEAAVDEQLYISAREANAHNSATMREFLNTYKLCDAKCKAAPKQFCSIADEALCANKRSYTAYKENTNSFHPYKNHSSNSQQSGSSSTKRSRPPKLTDDKHEVIRKFRGCFKC